MAILDSCPGLQVEVLSNEKVLNEHADNKAIDALNSTTNYIEVEEEGTFEVRLRFNDDYTCNYGVCVEIRLYGINVDSCTERAG